MNKTLLYFLLCLLPLIGCKPQTYIYAINGKITKTNHSPADSLDFKFKLTGNGVWFNIINHSNTNALLLWDETYITLPSGNSYKMFNPDLLEENILDNNVAQKSLNTGLIPANKSYARFSSSTSSIGKRITLASYNWKYYNFFYSYNHITKKGYTNNYWPTSFINEETEIDVVALEKNTSLIFDNPSLSVGFTIEQKGQTAEYHFDFVVDTIKLFQLSANQDKMYYVGQCSKSSDEVKCSLLSKKLNVDYIQLNSTESVVGFIRDSTETHINVLNIENGEMESYSKNDIKKYWKSKYTDIGYLLN